MTLPAPWNSLPAVAGAFLPTLLQFDGLLAVLACGLVMVVLGRAAVGPRTTPETALIAGWGVIVLVLTLWGVMTPATMRIPAVGLAVAAALCALASRGRLGGPDLTALARLLVLSLPLLAVMAASMPAQPDTFTNQLPNAAYLYDFGQFPAKDRPPMLAVWPAFPYNLQLATLLPALLAQGFPPNILTHVNLLLQLAFALLLARAMRGGDPVEEAPSWSAIAGALLLTSFLNPGFNPKIQFSSYADPAIAAAMPFVAWQAERVLADLAVRRGAATSVLSLAFVLVAAIAIKQVSVVLTGAVVATAFLIGAFDRRIGAHRAFGAFAQAYLPAALLLIAWRLYVASHFLPDDELGLLPVRDWNLMRISAILRNMGAQIWEKAPFFILLYGVALAAIPLTLRRGLTPAARLFLLTLGATAIYTGFLVFSYIAHFPGEMGESAHSFFRYNTHLGLMATLAVVVYAREGWVRRGAPALGPDWRVVRWGALALAVAAPLASAGWIRFDLRQPEPLVWDLARFAAPRLRGQDRVALLLPGDNSSVGYMLRVAIAMTPPRHPLAHFDAVSRADAEALAEATRNGDELVLISCVPKELATSDLGNRLKLSQGKAAMLTRSGESWALSGEFTYPSGLPPVAEWTPQLSPGPFCD